MFLENAWYAAAWSREVGAGELFERTIADRSLLLFRGLDGVPVALGNACPHRFAPLHLGKHLGDAVECPYHGLRYDLSGQCIHNPHGNGKIPKNARTPCYPLVERYDLLWVWLGEAALADPETIPDFSCHADPEFPCVSGVIEMAANYELITDNLMDLSHVEYLHAGLLGSDAIKHGRHEILQEGTTVYSNRWCPDGLAPPAWDMMFDNYGKPVDHWLYMRWDAPATMLLDVGITPTGRPREDGIYVYGTDILAPRDANTTYYFWGVARSYAQDRPEVGEGWVEATNTAFARQDKPMIEAQARMLAGRDIDDMKGIALASDAGATRCRRVLRQLRALESDGGVPEPALLSLAERRDYARKHQDRVWPVL